MAVWLVYRDRAGGPDIAQSAQYSLRPFGC